MNNNKKPPYILARFKGKDGQFYFHVIRRRGGKIVLPSEGYASKQARGRTIITLLNTLFRPGTVEIIDKES